MMENNSETEYQEQIPEQEGKNEIALRDTISVIFFL